MTETNRKCWDILRQPDEEPRTYDHKDRARFYDLLKIAVYATFPAEHFVTPFIELQQDATKNPASLTTIVMTPSFDYYHDRNLGKAIGDSIISVFPLRIYNAAGTASRGTNINWLDGTSTRQDSKLSAHQKIEYMAKALDTFGRQSPIAEYITKNRL